MEIQELNQDLVHSANSNSFNGTRGTSSENCYKTYANEIITWNISDPKKQKLLAKLYKDYSEMMHYEAQHISVMVAGPSNYNSKLNKGDKILELSHNLSVWFESVKNQVEMSEQMNNVNKTKDKIDSILRSHELQLDATKEIMELATIDNKQFIAIFEQFQDKYKWRKNSNIYKLYQNSLNGNIAEIKKEVIFEDENLVAYIEGERAYIRFTMRPQRQLIVALKSRGWWWNSYASAWSTYLNRVDKDWISTISTQYAKYV